MPSMIQHSAAQELLQRLVLGLCLEEGAAWWLLLVCTNPCHGSLVGSPGSSPSHSPRDVSTL